MDKVENILNELLNQTPVTRGELNEVLQQIDRKFELLSEIIQKQAQQNKVLTTP